MRPKVYSLKIIQKAFEDEFELFVKTELLESMLDQAREELNEEFHYGEHRKRKVKWDGQIFESQRECGKHLRICEQLVHYYLKKGKSIQGHKIEYA